MAKLWILSDLHLETLPYPENFRPEPLAFDVLWNGVVDEDLILAKALAAQAGITLLDGTSAAIVGCRFVGTTLWGDDRLAGHLDPATPTGESIDVAHDEMGGHHGLTVGNAAALHRQAFAALGAGIATDDGALPLGVVTHHAPHPVGMRACGVTPDLSSGSFDTGIGLMVRRRSLNRPAGCPHRMAAPVLPD